MAKKKATSRLLVFTEFKSDFFNNRTNDKGDCGQHKDEGDDAINITQIFR